MSGSAWSAIAGNSHEQVTGDTVTNIAGDATTMVVGATPRASLYHVDGSSRLTSTQLTEIVSEKEVVLRCGKSSITLRADGRVSIRGKFVESCAEGTNRINGGSVSIN